MVKYTEQMDHPVISVDVIVKNSEGKILLIKRAVEPDKNRWSIIGEKIEIKDDSIEAAVKRGVKEEANLTVEIENLVDVVGEPKMRPSSDPRFYAVQIVYVTKMTGGELLVNDEVNEFKWVTLEEALKEKLAFNHHELLKIYQFKKNNNLLLPGARTCYTENYGKDFFYSKYKFPRLAVDAIVLNENNEILLARRRQWPYVGHWDFPGGHIYVGESVKECCRREVKEELGVESEVGELFRVYADKGQSPKQMDIVAFYFVKIESQKFIRNVEMDDFGFFPLNNLPDKIAYHHDRALTDLKKYFNIN